MMQNTAAAPVSSRSCRAARSGQVTELGRGQVTRQPHRSGQVTELGKGQVTQQFYMPNQVTELGRGQDRGQVRSQR